MSVQTTADPRARLLLVDDDPAVLHTLALMFEMLGVAVDQAQGGKAGLNAFQCALDRHQPYDVVFTDLAMPEIDGLAVASEVKRLRSSTQVVLLSGGIPGARDDGTTLSAEVDMAMRKPPRLADLQKAVTSLLSTG